MADREGVDVGHCTCSVASCGRKATTRGWCGAHYQRWRRSGGPERPPDRTCSIVDCDRPVVGRGWCGLHYQRWQAHGDPEKFIGRRLARDLTGQRFGRLTVRHSQVVNRRVRWLCDCDCGAMTVVTASTLVKGGTKSCGCLARETLAVKSRTHGLHDTLEYKTWANMRYRCSTAPPNSKVWRLYGGRGIVVAPEWESFERFLADMGPCPSGASIDRIDNDGPYAPGNCRWATLTEQGRNKRNNRFVTAFGETKVVADWLEDPRCMVERSALLKRINTGWPVERALTLPPRPNRRA